ncbi:hypothetical protein [Nostoc sp.]
MIPDIVTFVAHEIDHIIAISKQISNYIV